MTSNQPTAGATARRHWPARRGPAVLISLAVAGVLLAACGSGPTGSTTTTSGSGSSSSGATLGTASVAGLGTVVVDARGYTVYVLSTGSERNLPCTTGSGCTAAWPPLLLASGTSASTSGSNVQRSLIGHVVADGTTYTTYNGWRLYEFSGDTGPGQSGGQGLSSFGGTWRALDASGNPVTSTPSTTTSTTPGY